MRRVTSKDSWGKLTNNQITRWVGSRQIDMRAHGTQKTKTKAMCSHKTKTQAHGQQTNHQPCAKQDTNMQLMRKLRRQKSTLPSELETAHAHNGKRTWSASFRTLKRNRNVHSKPHAHVKTGHDRSIRALSQNHE